MDKGFQMQIGLNLGFIVIGKMLRIGWGRMVSTENYWRSMCKKTGGPIIAAVVHLITTYYIVMHYRNISFEVPTYYTEIGCGRCKWKCYVWQGYEPHTSWFAVRRLILYIPQKPSPWTMDDAHYFRTCIIHMIDFNR